MFCVRDVVRAQQPVAQLWQEPDAMSEVTTQLLYGCSAATIGEQPGWWKVRTDDGFEAWASKADVIRRQETYGDASSPVWQVSAHAANLYAERSVKSRPRVCVPFESRLKGLASADAAMAEDAVASAALWVGLELLDGTRAFTLRGNLVPHLPRLTLAESIRAAHRFLGVTYTWGGVSSFGFDCSGFVQMIFRQAGYTLPRNAAMQAAWDHFDVPADGPCCGDVLFFGASDGQIDHVGICVDSGTFLHATTHGVPGVQTSELAELYWQDRLLVRKRLRG